MPRVWTFPIADSTPPAGTLRLRVNAAAVFVAAAWLLTACSSTGPLAAAPEGAVDLSGMWVLDAHASDDVRARLLPLHRKSERRWQRQARRSMPDGDGDQSADGDGRNGQSGTRHDHDHDHDDGSNRDGNNRDGNGVDFSNFQWLRQERQHEFDALVDHLSAATHIEISQTPQSINISSDKGEGTRAIVPGETSSLFLSLGRFTVKSGWQHTTLVIDTHGEDTRLYTIERFTRLAPDRLDEILDVRLPENGKQTFHFVYKLKQ